MTLAPLSKPEAISRILRCRGVEGGLSNCNGCARSDNPPKVRRVKPS